MSRIRIVERTGSTNADLLADTSASEGDWLVALDQTGGRGRQGRSWETRAGNFFGSTAVELARGDPPAQSLSLAAGLALIEAVDAAAPDIPGRPTAHLGGRISPQAFAPLLAASVARLLALWRSSDRLAFAQGWLARAHPIGTALSVHGQDSQTIHGRFDGIEPDGTLRLRLADGSVRAIHAADVTLG